MLRLLLVGVVLLAIAWWQIRRDATPAAAAEGTTAVQDALRGDAADPGFLRAEAPRDFAFPADHGPHPGFRTEWWYVTGQLEAEAGWRGGFQFTLFRQQMTPQPTALTSPWACTDLYLLHLGLTTPEGFHSVERLARGGDGRAGAVDSDGRSARTWLGGSSLSLRADGAWILVAEQPAGRLELVLTPRKEPVLHGDAGRSVKSADGAASYYYSQTRLELAGSLAGRPVRGGAWLDREWSTSALGAGQVGWDWFAMQLDDGRELMLYRMRREEGGSDPTSHGSLVAADGTVLHLGLADFVISETAARWHSPATGRTWPVRWHIAVAGLDLHLAPLREDQEHRGRLPYWEGAIEVRAAAGHLLGRGYQESTGY